MTASWQKVFSDVPALGFFAQRARYQEALEAGKVLPPAKSLEDMQAVVTNSTVDGVLAAFFAILVVIVIADAARVWIRALRSPTPLPTNPWYNSWIAPFQSEIATKMQSCASPGLYFEVSPSQGISDAMNVLFKKALSEARITQ